MRICAQTLQSMDPNDRPAVKECLSMTGSLECTYRQRKEKKKEIQGHTQQMPSERTSERTTATGRRVVWELMICAHRSLLYLQSPIS